MNTNVMPSRVQMEQALLQNLVAEVKETIATVVEMNEAAKQSSFKAINFWNLRRNGRTINAGSSRKKSTSVSLTHVSF